MPRTDPRAGYTATERGLGIEIRGLLLLLAALAIGYVALQHLNGTALKIATGAALGVGLFAKLLIEDGQAWQRGGAGEERVGKALRPLERRGWVIEHDLMKPTGGNIDHLAAGPGGVFTIETKANRFGGAGIRQARSHASYASKRLGVPVTPLICVANSKARPKEYGGVLVVRPRDLASTLERACDTPAPETPEFTQRIAALRNVAAGASAKSQQSPASGRWIQARYEGRCRRCNGAVHCGDRVWHDRVQRAVWCGGCAPNG